jgi:hypothetical protein
MKNEKSHIEKFEVTGKISGTTDGIPWLFRGQTVGILDCEEIDEENEKYTYWVEMVYNGRKFRTWINSEDIEVPNDNPYIAD